MALPRALERPHGDRISWLEAESLGGVGSRELLRRIARALPRNQSATEPEQRRGVLDQHGQCRERPGGDDVVSPLPLVEGPLLGSGWNRSGIGEAGTGGEASDDLALAPSRLDEVDLRVGKGNGERQAGEPSSGPQVGDASGGEDGRHMEPAEAVRQMLVERRLGVGDRGRRRDLGRQRLEQGDQLVGGRIA